MNELLRTLTWDTQFFGFKIGRVLPSRLDTTGLAAILELAKQERFRCLYFQADPDDAETVSLAEEEGFHLVDVRIVLEHPFDDRPAPVPRYPTPEAVRLGPPHRKDIPALEEIAIETGHTSRFRFDRNFPADACARLYHAWLHKALTDDSASVIVAYWHDSPVGLIACAEAEEVGHIQLAGVYSPYRSHGIGTALVQGSLDWFRQREVARAEVVTQARNVLAQRLYQQMGFFTRRMTLYYHKWIE